ncbi:hypothetical protein FCL42_04855 [Ferrimonas aestuarii]|uniref:RNA methyltransferase n=1 Tax=Ferrimonas aestuarii TaxID=2569539 RepID=A0A4U1BSL3_9GAMM|nr:hypothetical protein FCL42_04855 [Ferrimonas aestuarii]
MVTYKNIQEDVKASHNITVKTCWIAHVKELNGLPLRKANNRISENERKYECPNEVRPLIEASMRKFGML